MEINQLYQLFLKHPCVSTDSRNISKNTLFFALRGENFNGNAYAADALKKGASYAIIDDAQYLIGEKTILVEDTLAALQAMARHHVKTLKSRVKIIGLTGSNGKTTTKELMHAVLSKKYHTLATKGNLNNHIGVPLTCLEINQQTDIAIIEMGANHQGEITVLSSLAQPGYGIIINIGHAHLEGFGGPEGVLKGKSELFDYVNRQNGKILINANQPLLMQQESKYSCEKIFFGIHKDSKVVAEPIEEQSPFLKIRLYFPGGEHEKVIETHLTGTYNIDNILAATAIGLEMGVNHQDIFDALATYFPKNNRSQIIEAGSNQIIMDAYNANPTSMKAAIDNLDKIKTHQTKIAILGEMKELGDFQFEAHRQILQNALGSSIAHVITVGKAFAELNINNEKLTQYHTIEELSEHLKTKKPDNSIILLKGSRSNRLESVMTYLEEKQ
ncbi:MAG: UDP-N-acetylmuramoyl-tripeptide--D-alanyl-D-alanine ligase [Bacteroidota bacterium]